MSSNVPSVRNISVSTAQSNKLPLGLLLQRRRRPALHCTSSPRLHLARTATLCCNSAPKPSDAVQSCSPSSPGLRENSDFLEAVNPVWVRAYLHGRPLGADGIKHTSECWCFNASRWKTADPAWLTAPGVFLLAGRTKEKHNKAPGRRKCERSAGNPNQLTACLSRFPLNVRKPRRL